MYLAKYNLDDDSWFQAGGRLAYPAPADPDADLWWDRLRSLLRALDSVPGSSASLRIRFEEAVASALFVTARTEHEGDLRRALASFAQLDVAADGAVEFSGTRADHDRLLTFPALRCRVLLPHMTSGDAWFAFDFRAAPFLNGLLAEARAMQYGVSYHVNVEPLSVRAEWQRLAARNALRVADLRGAPQPLVDLQRRRAEALGRVTHIAEEILGVDNERALDWLRDALVRRFRDSYGRFVEVDFPPVDDGADDLSLVATRHRLLVETLGVDEICSTAITPSERVDLLSWRPDAAFVPATASAPASPAAEPLAVPDYGGMPRPYTGPDPYVFISYKRDDLPRVKPLVSQMHAAGYQIWYDKGIPGGAEWDALIEERVRHCEVLVLFLSQAAVGSRYVRREVKFADTLGKPIVGVRLDHEIDLAHGLAMLFHQYQMITGDVDTIADEVGRALRYVRLM